MWVSTRSLWLLLVAGLLVSFWLASAASAVSIDWVTVGDAGNAADTTGFGAVANVYRISKYEVTNAQYAEFLNATAKTDANNLYNLNMDPNTGDPRGGIERSGSSGSYTYTASTGRENKPVVFVSWYDSLRFANWVHNGQATPGIQDSSTTEDGAYTFTGTTSLVEVRNTGALVFLPTDDEWYKAAYYDVVAVGYSGYPFADGFNGAACEAPAGTTSHSGNCNNAVGDLTDRGAYSTSPSDYGTFDQGGNVWEWTESLFEPDTGLRGGSWANSSDSFSASARNGSSRIGEVNTFGFRVASVPEPGTGLLVMTGILGLMGWRRRSA